MYRHCVYIYSQVYHVLQTCPTYYPLLSMLFCSVTSFPPPPPPPSPNCSFITLLIRLLMDVPSTVDSQAAVLSIHWPRKVKTSENTVASLHYISAYVFDALADIPLASFQGRLYEHISPRIYRTGIYVEAWEWG